MEAMSGRMQEAADRKLTSQIELTRAACMVAAIRRDQHDQKGVWPRDYDLIRGIRHVLLIYREENGIIDEIRRARAQLLPNWIESYLDSFRPRLHLISPAITPEDILARAKEVQDEFWGWVADIEDEPEKVRPHPTTPQGWIEASAYHYVQMQEKMRERAALQRSEFEGVEPLENGE